jgi:acetoin utilization deacetylase AcuC-like enzyme
MSLPIFYSADSVAHDPQKFFRRGTTIAHPEGVSRYQALWSAIAHEGFDLHQAADAGWGPLQAVHSQGYLDFLAQGWSRRGEIGVEIEELLTTQFARPQMHRKPDSLLGQLGYYCADTSTPLRAGTWAAVYGSAQCAVAAADAAIVAGRAYALCRPPGHHAFADSAGGFCYVNNTAIAAQRLLSAERPRIAVVDIDVHHGNGTQGIFYERNDILTVSIHADTANFFPFYSGYADELGRDTGLGFNLNLPLPHGSGDSEFLSALDSALARVRIFSPSALVVALGLDASEHDPLSVLKVTTLGFVRAAEAIGRLAIPTAIIQEGGYLGPALEVNLRSFLRRFDLVHRDFSSKTARPL